MVLMWGDLVRLNTTPHHNALSCTERQLLAVCTEQVTVRPAASNVSLIKSQPISRYRCVHELQQMKRRAYADMMWLKPTNRSLLVRLQSAPTSTPTALHEAGLEGSYVSSQWPP